MKNYLIKLFIVLAILFSSNGYAQKENESSIETTIAPEDLNNIIGKWSGTLTYMDYSSNKPYTMPADLTVKQGANENQLLLFNIYPNEPKANSKDKITVSKNGNELNKKHIKSKQVLANGNIKITTEYKGKDNKKKASIRNVYLLGNNQFVIRKEVKYENSELWIKRNEYSYIRQRQSK